MEITLKPTFKQHMAYEALKDDTIKYVVFGGGAGGGKSWLGAEWLLTMCLMYPGTKWFIGREELKRLMASSYVTFQKVCKYHKIPEGTWKLNGQYNYIEFDNGSRIDLIDLVFKPSDPMYERFGSLEYTAGWIEEAGEVHFDAYDVLKSRIGRHMNKEYNIKSKLLLTCNPKKNFLYTQFYKPWKEKVLSKNSAFIQALYNDNPYTADEYGENLKELRSETKKQRLMLGNWEYDEDAAKLMDYDAICDLFSNKQEESEDKYLVIDVAGEGKDKCTIYYWEGWQVKKIYVIDRSNAVYLQDYVVDICNEKNIPRSHVLGDATGIGWGVVDNLKCKAFVSANAAVQPEVFKTNPKLNEEKKVNYHNLRSQCFFLLADKINSHEIGIDKTEHEETIKEELECIKEVNQDNEKRLLIIGKEDIKGELGRSPDHADNLMMRMVFELKTPIKRKPMNLQPRKNKVNYVTGKRTW